MEDGFQDGLRDTLLRGPKAVVLCIRKPSYSDLWSVLGVTRTQVNAGDARGMALQETACARDREMMLFIGT